MDVIGCSITQSDIQPAVAITKTITAGSARSIEQHGKAAVMHQVAVVVALISPGNIQGHCQVSDGKKFLAGKVQSVRITQAAAGTIGNDLIDRKAVGDRSGHSQQVARGRQPTNPASSPAFVQYFMVCSATLIL